MPPHRRSSRPVSRAGVAASAVLVLALAGCGEAGPVDDGSYSALQAGAPDVLAGLGVTLVTLDTPTSADPNDVDAVLASRRFDAETYAVRPVDGLAFEPEKVAGLLGMAGNVEGAAGGDAGGAGDGRFVVLCFDRLEAAIVFAESDPEIFDDAGLEADRSAYFSGNLVAYYASQGTDDVSDRFQAALEDLAGVGAWGRTARTPQSEGVIR